MLHRAARRGSHAALVLLVYLAAYFAASWLDLASTQLGLQRPGTSEKNVFAITSDGTFDLEKAWLITLGGAVILGACVLYAVTQAGRVDEHWLRHPVRAMGQFHLNPFSPAALRFAPLQLLTIAIAFPILRAVAAANNMLLYWIGWGPLGALIKALAAVTSPLIGFAVVVILALVLVMVLVAPATARLLRRWRS